MTLPDPIIIGGRVDLVLYHSIDVKDRVLRIETKRSCGHDDLGNPDPTKLEAWWEVALVISGKYEIPDDVKRVGFEHDGLSYLGFNGGSSISRYCLRGRVRFDTEIKIHFAKIEGVLKEGSAASYASRTP